MAAAVSADQECEDGRGEDGAGPPEQIFFPKLTKRLLGRESFMITNIQSSSHRCLVFCEGVFSGMILTWKPNQLFCLFCEESGVNMPSQAVYRHVCKHHQIIIITLSALVFKQLTKYFDK